MGMVQLEKSTSAALCKCFCVHAMQWVATVGLPAHSTPCLGTIDIPDCGMHVCRVSGSKAHHGQQVGTVPSIIVYGVVPLTKP